MSIERARLSAIRALAGACALLGAAPSLAQKAPASVIAGYGTLIPPTPTAMMPDPALRYRVAFEITRAAADPATVNPALDRLARFINLLGAAGIKPASGDIVAVIHGPATSALLSEAAYQSRYHRANPNTALLAALSKAGVAVHVCSYALAAHKIAREEVASGVTVDLAAMVTLATLQLRGWAVIQG